MALALLLAVLGVSSASASWSDVQKAGTWVGEPTDTHHLEFGSGGDYFDCTDTGFNSSAGGGSIFIGTPKLAGCTSTYAGGFAVADWKMNGCEFVFNLGAKESDPGTVDINNCDAPISWQINSVVGTCLIEIPMQSTVSALQYTATGSEAEGNLTLTIAASLSGIKYRQTGNYCKHPGEHSNGTYTGTWHADNGVRFNTSGGSGVGGSGLEDQLFYFDTEGAEQLNADVKCSTVSYSGDLLGNWSTAQITPSYSGCKMKVLGFNINATASMGSCSYRLTASGGLSIYGGSGCAAKPITIRAANAFGECKIEIGPQSLGLIGLQNKVSFGEQYVDVSPDVSSIEYTATGEICNGGTFDNGTLSGKSKLTSGGGLWIG